MSKHFYRFLITSFGIFGFVALVFQVVFAKQLVLLFGLTAPAVATVLAVFFFGMALGSFVFGGIADKRRLHADSRGIDADQRGLTRIMKLYFGLFVLTGIYGFLFPLIYKFLNFLILWVDKIYPLNFSGFNFFAFLFSFIFLAPPAILFGAGFPVISKILIREENLLGKKISLLYFINTFGSVVGALFAGFWLIPTFGNNITIFLASGLNIILAAAFFFLFKEYRERSEQVSTGIKEYREQGEPVSTNIQNPIFLYVLFITGFLALALEVLYTKTLILFIGSSTYAFSLILITFLLGIALGSWVASLFIDRLQKATAYFGMFLGLIGFWLFITLKMFEHLPFWYLKIFQTFEASAIFSGTQTFYIIFFTQLVLTFFIIFPATFLMGLIFPLGIKLASPALERLGEGVGKLYFSNTLGGVLGSLMVGFLFLPIFGFQKSLLFIMTIYFILGIFFILRESLLDKPIKIILIGFLIFWNIFAILSPSWAKQILSSGVFIYAPEYLSFKERIGKNWQEFLRKGMASDQLLFYKEGLSQIAVIKRGNDIFLRINGKTDASNSAGDLEHEILTGALPLILHEDPKDVLMIGFGSGISLGAAAQFDETEKIEMVEIDPAVVEAAQYFKDDNHDALNNSKAKIILADGRNYLYLTDKKYDVISSQPSNIWVSGNVLLFTKEYYELAKKHLKENGLMFQWVQLYGLRLDDLKTILKTFSEVFPNTYIFSNVNDTDLFLVGTLNNDTIFDFKEIERKLQNKKIQDELTRISINDPYEFLSFFVATNKEIEKMVSDSEIHSDNRPFLEFSAPKTVYQLVDEKSSETILKLREEVFSKLYSGSIEGPEIIKGLSAENKEKLKNYLVFRQKIIPIILALREGDLDKALEFYKEAQKTEVFNALLYKRLINACMTKAEFVELQQGKDAAEKVWSRCDEVLMNKIESK
jgi:spermidine synthase